MPTPYHDTATFSLPREKIIRGYPIRRMPIGQFLVALETLRELPGELLDTLLPGLTPGTLSARLKTLTADELKEMAIRLVTVLPGYGVRLLSQLMGIEEQALLGDEKIGLDGLGEMLTGWMEVNGIENFIKAAGALREKVHSAISPIGCKGSSQER